jgi:DNA-directed RNA polymerase subunit D
MVPIPTNHEQFHYQETCPNCKDLIPEDRGCPACNMIYTCKAFGSPEGTTVTAGDMIYLGDESLEIPEHYRSIPITKLYKGQMLEFYATAVMGRGSQHAKWSPVCGVSFIPRKIGVLNNKSKAKILWGLNLTITAKDFDKEGRLEDVTKVETLIKELYHVGDGTEKKGDFKEAITIEEVPGEYIFSFETDGSMDPQTALKMASASLSATFSSLGEDLAAVL